MARIRFIKIENFRSIKSLNWHPNPGINCLVGPGDSGKSTIVDAIELCLGQRRAALLNDSDFYQLDYDTPITIEITFGDLSDQLKKIDAYGAYVRGFNPDTGAVEDEPAKGLETVLTMRMTVGNDLEPEWMLISERATAQSMSRNLAGPDRASVAPTRLGATTHQNLSWRKGSLLSSISDEEVDVSAALTDAGRQARANFGAAADAQLSETLEIVTRTAKDLGVPVGDSVSALLDIASVSFKSGMVSLHDEGGIPLSKLGLGSTRLLIAGLQREASASASIILIDEIEHGLEPHRIIRLLGTLGAKEVSQPLQVFMTTHSPVVLNELSGDQLYVLRKSDDHHAILNIGISDDVQGTIRKGASFLLAAAVIVCEGPTEIGFLRGLDQFRSETGYRSLMSYGVALVDGGGNDMHRRALAIQSLGYRTALLRDSDIKAPADLEQNFMDQGGVVFAWADGRAIEDEIFMNVTEGAALKLIELACELKSQQLVDEQIKAASKNAQNIEGIKTETLVDFLSPETRTILGKAARSRDPKRSWFKSISSMLNAAHSIIGPDLDKSGVNFRGVVTSVFDWASNGST